MYLIMQTTRQSWRSTWPRLIVCAGLGIGLLTGPLACRNVLGVPIPAGAIDPGALGGNAGADAQREGAIAAFANAFDVQYSGLLTDEFTNYFLQGSPTASAGFLFVDARNNDATNTQAQASGSYPFTDPIYIRLQQARINAQLAKAALAQSATARSQGMVGEMLALAGYTEVLLAEEFCSGVPVGEVLPGGGEQHGTSLTTDSLLGRAVADFDSALANGVGNDTALNLARVGLGRALLDRGRYAAAAAAVAAVPAGFTYTVFLPASPQGTTLANFYAQLTQFGGEFVTVADREGSTGLNFVSARDPRMPIDSSLGPTRTGTPFYYPAKFPVGSPPITLADWIEARLIGAEGALASGDVPGWTSALNGLRADSADTHVSGLRPLTSDSTTTASTSEQVDVMFRERGFWLFVTGHRLGDLRRLIRQYGRDPNTVFPTGPYPASPLQSLIATYGTDVTFPIAAVESANPNFHGCLNRSA